MRGVPAAGGNGVRAAEVWAVRARRARARVLHVCMCVAEAASACLAVVAGKAEAVAESAQVLGRDGDRVAALALEAVLGAHRGQQLAHRVLRPAHELVELGGELVGDPVGAPSEVPP